jgi:predicted nucleotidyltransferase
MIPNLFKSEILAHLTKNSTHLSWLETNTIYLVRHGSVCYGTNIKGSDIDYRGVCIPTKQYYLGAISIFEQAEMHDPDITVFELGKFFRLASDCNPNALEILFVDPSDIIHIDPLGEKLLANRDFFLSKRVKHTMTGYAVAQLKRIKLHRAYCLNPPKKYPTRMELGLPEQTLIPQDQLLAATAEVQKELDKYQFDYLEGLDEPTKIGIRNTMANMLAELKITTSDLWMSAARKQWQVVV